MAQIQKGTTFGATAPDNLVTYTNLNAHVDSAILLPGAITDQTALTTTATDDQVLVSDTSASNALRKVTLANLLPTGGVATAKLADSAVTAAKLASDAVTTAKVLDANITAAKLASDAVTTAKVLDAAITAAKLASTLDLSSKTVTLPSDFPGAYYTGTAASTLAAGILEFTHGLVTVPRIIQVRAVCTTAQSPWTVNTELSLNHNNSGGADKLTWWADATKIYVALYDASISVTNGSGSFDTLTAGSWKIKVLAWK